MAVDDRRDVVFTGIGDQDVRLCSKVRANAAVAARRPPLQIGSVV
jgi:hypothetical protein